jgi:HlyD family secretion protein
MTESEQVVHPGTPLLEIGDPADKEIEVELLSRYAVRVQEGASAVVSGWGGAPIPARVERVEPVKVSKVSAIGINEQRVKVILALTGPADDFSQLDHGFRVISRISLWQQDNVLTIPVGALFRDGGDWATYVLRDGQAELRPLTLGERNEAFAQVLEGGVQAGGRVILHTNNLAADSGSVTALAEEADATP